MNGFLRIEKVGSAAMFDLLRESSLLSTSDEEEFTKLLLCMFIRRASLTNDLESRSVVENMAPVYRKDAFSLVSHWSDELWLTNELAARAKAIAKRLSEELAFTKIGVSVSEESLTFEIVNRQRPDIKNIVSIEASLNMESFERCNLLYSIENCLDGEIQTFGPMLSGYVFGRVHDGASRTILCGKRPVMLKLSDDEIEISISTAAEALKKVLERAEKISPVRIVL